MIKTVIPLGVFLFAVVAVLLPAALAPALAQEKQGQEETTAPIPLRTPLPQTPMETAGTGIAPSVRVELDVDERGVVSAVKILSIEPSTAFDHDFEVATREALRAWRFAPARKKGGTTAAVLTWTVRFPALDPGNYMNRSTGKLPVSFFLRPRTRRPGSSAEKRARLLALPLRQRIAMLQIEIEKAEKLLDAKARVTATTERFVFVTDAANAEAARGIASGLEAAYATTYDVLAKELPSQPARGKVHAYLFASRQAYHQLSGESSEDAWTAGFYSPVGLIAFHAEAGTADDLLSVLIHETVHALMDRHIIRPGVQLPTWLSEGFAEYMANSDIKKGKLIPGGHRKRWSRPRISVWGGFVRAARGSFVSARDVKRAINEGKALTVEEIFDARRMEFYGDKRDLFYPQSWMLVHFLRHGEPEWAAKQFPEFMLYVCEGYDPREAFIKVYGAPPGSFEAAYRQYVKRF